MSLLSGDENEVEKRKLIVINSKKFLISDLTDENETNNKSIDLWIKFQRLQCNI